MVSFDVVSLFTSIPLTTAKHITDELLTSNSSWTNRTLLSQSDILHLLDICPSTEFQFDGSFYKQSAGTPPMGNPLSSFLAEAVMQDLENQTLTNDMHIKLWDRYVDDTFSIIKTHHIKKVFDTINTTDGIIFTMEKEKNGEIAFLDIKLSRTEHGSIETQVYGKNTHTDRILNYHSNHPTQHKISCIRTLINRIDTHCNTTETKKNEFDHLQKTFRKNCYPSHFIKSIYNRNQNIANKDPNIHEVTTRRVSLPYINKISEITARILKKHNVEVAHKPTNKFKSMFNKHKHHRKPLDRNNVIYKIPCQDCEQVYINETSNTANTRITEHKNAIRREDSRSLPATHVINHNHRFDWTKTTILDNGTTREAREMKEAWHSQQNPAINRHIDIPTAYTHLT